MTGVAILRRHDMGGGLGAGLHSARLDVTPGALGGSTREDGVHVAALAGRQLVRAIQPEARREMVELRRQGRLSQTSRWNEQRDEQSEYRPTEHARKIPLPLHDLEPLNIRE